MNILPDLFIQNIGQLVTVTGASHKPKTFHDMDEIGIIQDGAVFIKDGNFIDIGTTKKLKKKACRRKHKNH